MEGTDRPPKRTSSESRITNGLNNALFQSAYDEQETSRSNTRQRLDALETRDRNDVNERTESSRRAQRDRIAAVEPNQQDHFTVPPLPFVLDPRTDRRWRAVTASSADNFVDAVLQQNTPLSAHVLENLTNVARNPQRQQEWNTFLTAFGRRLSNDHTVLAENSSILPLIANSASDGNRQALSMIIRIAGMPNQPADFAPPPAETTSRNSFSLAQIPDNQRNPFAIFNQSQAPGAAASNFLIETARNDPARRQEILRGVLEQLNSGQNVNTQLTRTFENMEGAFPQLIDTLRTQASSGNANALYLLSTIAVGRFGNQAGAQEALNSVASQPVSQTDVINAVSIALIQNGALGDLAQRFPALSNSNNHEVVSRSLGQVGELARAGNRDAIAVLTRIWAHPNQPEAVRSVGLRLIEELVSANSTNRRNVIDAMISEMPQRRNDQLFVTVLARIASEQPPGSAVDLTTAVRGLNGFARADLNRAREILVLVASGANASDVAGQILVRVAQNPERTQQIIDSIMQSHRRFSDQGNLMATLGEIAATTGRVSPEVRNQIETAFRDNLRRQHQRLVQEQTNVQANASQSADNSAELRSAFSALLRINQNQLDQLAIDSMLRYPSPQLAALIRDTSAITADQRRFLAEAALRGTTERGNAASINGYSEMVIALMPYLRAEDFTRLAGGSSSGDAIRLSITNISVSLLRHGSPEQRAAASEHIIRNGWHPSQQVAVRNAVRDHLRTERQTLEQQDRALRAMRNLDLPVPLAVQMRRIGVHPDYTDSQIQELADRIESRHGDQASVLFGGMIAYNNASPELRAYLRNGALPAVEDGRLQGNSLLPVRNNQTPLIHPNAFADQLANGTLSLEHSFVADLPQRIVDLREVGMRERNRLIVETQRLTQERNAAMGNAVGAGQISSAVEEEALYRPGEALPAGWSNPHRSQIARGQSEDSLRVRALNPQIRAANAQLRSISDEISDIDSSLAVFNLQVLTASGQTNNAQTLAMNLHTDRTIRMTPQLRNMIDQTGLWRALELEGNTNIARLRTAPEGVGAFRFSAHLLREPQPIFSSSTSGDHSSARALQLESMFFENVRNTMMREPSLGRITGLGEQIAAFGNFANAFQQLSTGHTRTPEVVALMRNDAAQMRRILEGVDSRDIEAARQMMSQLTAISQDQSINSASREFARQMVEQMSPLINVLDPGSEQHNQLMLTCRAIENGNLDEPSTWQQIATGAVHVVTAVALASLVISTYGAGAAVLLVAVPLATAATREVVDTSLHLLGSAGLPGQHRGGIISSWVNGNILLDPQTGRLREQTGREMAGDLAFSVGRDIVMNGITMGVGHVGGRIGDRIAGNVLRGNAIRNNVVENPSFSQLFRSQIGPALTMDGANHGLNAAGINETAAGMGIEFFSNLIMHGRAPNIHSNSLTPRNRDANSERPRIQSDAPAHSQENIGRIFAPIRSNPAELDSQREALGVRRTRLRQEIEEFRLTVRGTSQPVRSEILRQMEGRLTALNEQIVNNLYERTMLEAANVRRLERALSDDPTDLAASGQLAEAQDRLRLHTIGYFMESGIMPHNIRHQHNGQEIDSPYWVRTAPWHDVHAGQAFPLFVPYTGTEGPAMNWVHAILQEAPRNPVLPSALSVTEGNRFQQGGDFLNGRIRVNIDNHAEHSTSFARHVYGHEIGHYLQLRAFNNLPQAERNRILGIYRNNLENSPFRDSPHEPGRWNSHASGEYSAPNSGTDGPGGYYFTCFPELFAEMYAIYRHGRELPAGSSTNYRDLIFDSTAHSSTSRTHRMLVFEPLYNELRRTIFEPTSTSSRPLPPAIGDFGPINQPVRRNQTPNTVAPPAPQ